LATRVRVKLRDTVGPLTPEQDRVIEVVVNETLERGEDQ
jgi:hypothetical protein